MSTWHGTRPYEGRTNRWRVEEVPSNTWKVLKERAVAIWIADASHPKRTGARRRTCTSSVRHVAEPILTHPRGSTMQLENQTRRPWRKRTHQARQKDHHSLRNFGWWMRHLDQRPRQVFQRCEPCGMRARFQQRETSRMKFHLFPTEVTRRFFPSFVVSNAKDSLCIHWRMLRHQIGEQCACSPVHRCTGVDAGFEMLRCVLQCAHFFRHFRKCLPGSGGVAADRHGWKCFAGQRLLHGFRRGTCVRTSFGREEPGVISSSIRPRRHALCMPQDHQPTWKRRHLLLLLLERLVCSPLLVALHLLVVPNDSSKDSFVDEMPWNVHKVWRLNHDEFTILGGNDTTNGCR